MKNKIFLNLLYAMLIMFSVAACKKESVVVADEGVKDIIGAWKIKTLVRNGEDLSARLDLSKFRIIFNADGTYTFVDKMAFVTNEPGTFSLDDPQYPFELVITPQTQTATTLKFQFPVIEGKRQLSLTLRPGCASNIYVYNFTREN